MKWKKIIVLLFLAGAARAQEERPMTFEFPKMIEFAFDQVEREVTYQELPAKIKAALTHQKNEDGWIMYKAFVVQFPTKPSATFYRIDLIKGTESKTIKLDADGEIAM